MFIIPGTIHLCDITKAKEIGKRENCQSQTKATLHNKKWRITDQKIIV